MLEGPLAALDAIEQATGERERQRRSATASAARCSRRRSPTWRRSATTGSRARPIFVDDGRLHRGRRARRVHRRGAARRRSRQRMSKNAAISKAREMATTFNMLRANDLIWSFVVNNYLLGKRAVPVRPAVLELRLDAHAGGDAQLLPAQHVPGEPAGASRAASRSTACRSICARSRRRPISAVDPRGPHRAVADRPTRRRSSISGPVQVRAVGLRATSPAWSTRRGSKYGHWINDEQPADPGGMARRRDRSRRLVVAGLGAVGRAICRRRGAGAPRRATAS